MPPLPSVWEAAGLRGWSGEGGARALLRTGPLRFRRGHADLLHLDLWDGALNLLRDGGTGAYNPPPDRAWWHAHLTGTAAHNTVEFDGADPDAARVSASCSRAGPETGRMPWTRALDARPPRQPPPPARAGREAPGLWRSWFPAGSARLALSLALGAGACGAETATARRADGRASRERRTVALALALGRGVGKPDLRRGARRAGAGGAGRGAGVAPAHPDRACRPVPLEDLLRALWRRRGGLALLAAPSVRARRRAGAAVAARLRSAGGGRARPRPRA
jgi:hypothetical protein